MYIIYYLSDKMYKKFLRKFLLISSQFLVASCQRCQVSLAPVALLVNARNHGESSVLSDWIIRLGEWSKRYTPPFSTGEGKPRRRLAIWVDYRTCRLLLFKTAGRDHYFFEGGRQTASMASKTHALSIIGGILYIWAGYRKGGHVVLGSHICFNYAGMDSECSGISHVSILNI